MLEKRINKDFSRRNIGGNDQSLFQVCFFRIIVTVISVLNEKIVRFIHFYPLCGLSLGNFWPLKNLENKVIIVYNILSICMSFMYS
jgi:hypothetical protein